MRRRTLAEIRAAEEEMFDRLWHYRTVSGRTLEHVPAEALAPLLAIEEKYRDLAGDDPIAAVFIEGKLSALRWVLGSDWDFLDT